MSIVGVLMTLVIKRKDCISYRGGEVGLSEMMFMLYCMIYNMNSEKEIVID